MNIQLFLDNQELELTESVAFPLNKTFESLNNPTDIKIDYSKSINIPITLANNKIFANAYRLDKTIVGGGDDNLGMYLNPTKRIPFKMIYNGTLLMEGYAKFVSANYSTKNKYYTINLFGIIGEVFQELLSVVTNRSKLNGLDEKYLLDDSKYINGTITLNRNYVADDWWNDDNDVWVPNSEEIDNVNNIHDKYGFAPSHRGFYNNFNSNKIQTSNNEIIEITEDVRNAWNDEEDIYGADNIVGDGFPDYQMNQFRSNRLKPYIYFNHIMRMYVDKCKELTGYEMILDTNWFNVNNPYWAKLCYMLDFLDLDIVDTTKSEGVVIVEETNEIAQESTAGNSSLLTMDQMSVGSNKSLTNPFNTGMFNVGFGVEATHNVSTSKLRMNKIDIIPNTCVKFIINVYKIVNGSPVFVKDFKFWTNKMGDKTLLNNDWWNADTFLPMIEDTNRSGLFDRTAKKYYYVAIPNLEVEGDFSSGMQIDVSVLYNQDGGVVGNSPALYLWNWAYASNMLDVKDYIYGTNELAGDNNPAVWTAYIDNTQYLNNWREDTIVNISNLYQKEDPLFNVILQYTKMFGLIWDVNYGEKKIYVKTRHSMFKDIEIVDWNDKIDKSKDMIIKPLSFDTKSIKFNYDNVDGYRYSNYRDKYGLNIGEKKLNTGYEFNTSDKSLFKGIHPSSISSKSYVPYETIKRWNKIDVMVATQEQRILIDCESEDEQNSISINNWYLRGQNQENFDAIITDDTPLMVVKDEVCYIDRQYAIDNDLAEYGIPFPTFTTAARYEGQMTYGSFFNTPQVDYTYGRILQETIGSSIYDLFWKDYINEKYNVQNKTLTAYFKLSNNDFNQFRFNKLVTIDNQLFLVNKIFDYNINSNDSTKCELIQIQDTTALNSKTFNQYDFGVDEINFKGSSDENSPNYTNNDSYSISRPIYGKPIVNGYEISDSLRSYLDEATLDDMGNNYVYFVCSFVGLAGVMITGDIKFKYNDEVVMTIPVTLDYTNY